MKKSKIALLINNNISGNLIVSKLFPELLKLNLTPVIYILHPHVPKSAQIGKLQNFGFYDHTIGSSVLFPFLESKPTLLNEDKTPYTDIAYSYKQIADLYSTEVTHIENFNEPTEHEKVCKDKEIIGCISIRNLQIFKPHTIAAIKNSGKFLWNLHTGILPEYRGVFPQLWAMANDEKETGVTLHHVDEGIDTGPIICSERFPIDKQSSFLKIFFESHTYATSCIIKAIKSGDHKSVLEQSAQAGESNYYTFPTPKNCENWEKKGIHISNPKEIVDILSKSYSLEGSQHHQELRNALIQASAEWEQRIQRTTRTKKAA